jgi:hypothetical protein
VVDTHIKHKCEETFPCFYRQDDLRTFWDQAEAIPAAWEKVSPDNPGDELRVINTFRRLCLTLIEEREFYCAGFHLPYEQGWLDCEKCENSPYPYAGMSFSVEICSSG